MVQEPESLKKAPPGVRKPMVIRKVVAVALTLAAWGKASGGQHIAEAEYRVTAVFRAGQVADTITGTHKWTLRRMDTSTLEAEGTEQVRWTNPKVPPVKTGYVVQLSPSLQVVSLKRWETRAGIASCQFATRRLKCLRGNEQAAINMETPYDLFLLNPWFLGSIGRRVDQIPGRETPVQLAILDEPFGLGAFTATIRFVGTVQKTVGQQKIATQEFRLSAESLPPVRFWLTPGGLLVGYEVQDEMRTTMELVRYHGTLPDR
ncbi:MAG: hypothetical protein L0387_00365 [Acidobacteria bacterium]|nr:hypothetical protein [Acidobacteriota bacterium]MCI0718698.1 hypothetical protein [Acidobacteriota bacterium]